MLLSSIKAKIFFALVLIVAAVAGVVMSSSQRAVETTVVQTEERALDNALHLVEENIRGRYRTLLKDKVMTVQSRKQQLRDFDRVVLATLDGFAGMADAGRITEEEAQRLALRWLSRVVPAEGGYVFAYDAGNRALVYPEAEMLGADLGGFTDFKGRSVVNAAREEATRYGDTFLTYNWKEVGGTELKPQYGHFVPYRRWGWMIGSTGDVRAVEEAVSRQLGLLEDELREILPRIRMAGDGVVFLFGGDGRFVVPPAGKAAGIVTAPVIDRLKALARGGEAGGAVAGFVSAEGDRLQGRAIHLKALDWYVAALASEDAMEAPAIALIRGQAVIFAGALAVALLLAYLFAHRITRPLDRLAAYAKAIPETDFTRERSEGAAARSLPVERRDEIGRLAGAFVFMEESLHRNVRSLMEATSARQLIEGELNVARDIQMGLLPKLFPAFPDRPEIDLFSVLESAKEVGGDLFDYYFLDEHQLCFTIGDVAGKGVPAALFMAITKTLIKAAAEKNTDPAVMIDKVNDDLSRDNPNCIFVTLLIGILDVRTGEVRYANAGHNPPAVLRAEGAGEGRAVEMLRAISGPAAGVMDGLAYTALETRLSPGDILLLYTDGVTEAMDGAGSLYGERRLLAVATGTGADGDARTAVRRIMADVRAHAGGAEQSDDITILAIRYRGPTSA